MISSTPQAIEVWLAYPRRVKKPLAIRAIMKAIATYGFETILARTHEFSERSKAREMQFIPYPATFFNQEMFNDDYNAMFPISHSKPAVEIPIWQRLKATESALELLKRKTPSLPNKWLCRKGEYEKAVSDLQPFIAQRQKLKTQIEQLNSQLVGL